MPLASRFLCTPGWKKARHPGCIPILQHTPTWAFLLSCRCVFHSLNSSFPSSKRAVRAFRMQDGTPMIHYMYKAHWKRCINGTYRATMGNLQTKEEYLRAMMQHEGVATLNGSEIVVVIVAEIDGYPLFQPCWEVTRMMMCLFTHGYCWMSASFCIWIWDAAM